jgi:hypothetical protein
MSVEDMRRKGRWAVPFDGRAGERPLWEDNKDQARRFALSAVAWGGSVPSTVFAARRIAAKGRRALEQAKAGESTMQSRTALDGWRESLHSQGRFAGRR